VRFDAHNAPRPPVPCKTRVASACISGECADRPAAARSIPHQVAVTLQDQDAPTVGRSEVLVRYIRWSAQVLVVLLDGDRSTAVAASPQAT
jgi:hypothetical protein